MEDKGQILLYQTPDGETRIEVRLQGETVWLNLDQMAELFQRNKSTISRHIKNVFEEGELKKKMTVAKFATVVNRGIRGEVEDQIVFYNLDMIISVGYRVHSYRGVQFRMWATQILKDYIVKGFALNDDLLKRAGGGNYFDELLARIRDIRSSEKVFYRKVLEIYALSIDYDPNVEMTQQFFRTVQNKMHYSVHGHTAARGPMLRRTSWVLPLGREQCPRRRMPRLQRTTFQKKKSRHSIVSSACILTSQNYRQRNTDQCT